jgi:hypothetical protein
VFGNASGISRAKVAAHRNDVFPWEIIKVLETAADFLGSILLEAAGEEPASEMAFKV